MAEIEVSYRRITIQGIYDVSSALKTNPAVREIDLSYLK